LTDFSSYADTQMYNEIWTKIIKHSANLRTLFLGKTSA
jgi:hypothetical protein